MTWSIFSKGVVRVNRIFLKDIEAVLVIFLSCSALMRAGRSTTEPWERSMR